MNRLLILCIAIATLTIGCTPNDHYVNRKLGIQFQYPEGEWGEAYMGDLQTDGNMIFYDWGDNIEYIKVFEKEENQSFEDVILDLIEQEGKNPKNCQVIDRGAYWANPEYTQYIIDFADPEITYTPEELEAIEQAEADVQANGGFQGGSWKTEEIYNQRLIEACSEYADPLGLATCKTIRSKFLTSKSKFAFLPGLLCSPSFYDIDSIEFLKE